MSKYVEIYIEREIYFVHVVHNEQQNKKCTIIYISRAANIVQYLLYIAQRDIVVTGVSKNIISQINEVSYESNMSSIISY